MDADEVRGTMNAVLYGLIFTRELTDEEAERLGTSLARDDRRERFREAITTVLRDGRLPEQALELRHPHTEAELLAFLTRVNTHLEPTG